MSRNRPKAAQKHKQQYWKKHDKGPYRCPDCGRLSSHPDVDRLEVHHIDGNPSNGSADNLIGLCRHCHYIRHDKEPPKSLEDWKAQVYQMQVHTHE